MQAKSNLSKLPPGMLVIAIIIAAANGLDLRRKARQAIRPQDVVMISEEAMKKMTPEMLQILNLGYTREFFKPVNKELPTTTTLVLDKRSFLREPPYANLIKDLENVQEVDFDERVRQAEDIFLPVYLHEMETEKRAKNLGQDHEEFLSVNIHKMLVMLDNVFTLPRSYRSEKSLRNAASDYISQKLGNLGLLVGIQYFYPSRFYEQFVGYDPMNPNPLDTLPHGGNVFGILPGKLWGTSRDRVVVVGAHWDTIESTDGYNDNGSGVAAVLEVARQIVESHCQPKNTIIFATFDLEEMGGQGSNEFVVRFLVPEILRKYGQSDIEGAFIADTIMNLNRTKNSQMLPDAWTTVDKVTAQKVEQNDFRGDFLAVVQRRQPDQKLVKTFSKYWHLQDEKFKLRTFRIDIDKKVPSIEELTDLVPFVRSDHSRFWIVNETDFTSLPAILITDTGPLRGSMVECYHQACDSVRSPYKADFADMDFYQHIVQSLLSTIIELSKSQCLRSEDLTSFYQEEDQSNNVSAASSGSFLGGSLLSLTEFIRRFMPWKLM